MKSIVPALCHLWNPRSKFRFSITMTMALCISGGAAESARAADILVPADQPAIQSAIDAAFDGDRVIVAPGTYIENIDFLGKAITVQSESGPDVTIIDGGGADTVVRFETAEGRTSVLNGFTVTNGFSTFDGGGIQISSASPTITGNHIVNNRGCTGIGIRNNFGSSLIQSNVIAGNLQSGCSGGPGGGGIYIGGNSAAEVIGNTITDNELTSANGAGISLFAAGTPIIRDNFISGNSVSGISPAARGGGIWIVNVSNATIVQNVITNNTADQGGGVYWLVPSSGLGPVLENNTVALNVARQGDGSEVFADGFDTQASMINNLAIGTPGQTAVFCGNSGDALPPAFGFNNIFNDDLLTYGGICADQTGLNGNISADPLFADAPAGDFRLRIGSPAAEAGDNAAPNLPALDILGNARIIDSDENGTATIDIGAIERLVNDPPVANAGPDQTVLSSQTVLLDGTSSFDPDGAPDGSDLAYEWRIGGSVIATGVTASVGPFPAAGTVSITLTVTDAQGDIDLDAMVVTSETQPPVADAGPDQTVTDFETVLLDGSGSSDPEGTQLSFVWTIAGTQIAIGAMPTVGPFAVGTHEITLAVTDADGQSASDIITLTVVPEPPVASDDLALLPNGRTVTIDVLANDTDVFGAGLSVLSIAAPSNGTATLNTDDTVTYRRDSSFRSGCDQFGYSIEDGRGTQATGTVFVNVGNVSPCGPPQPNSPPVANNDAYSMTQGTSLTIGAPGVLGNDSDADGDPLTAALQSGPASGALVFNANGGFTYTPPASLTGDIGFTYLANDGTDDSNIATAVITINPQGTGTVHAGDIDGTAIAAARGKWSASVAVEVHGGAPGHDPIADAQIFGRWQGTSGETACVTDGNGRCSLEALSIGKNRLSVTFVLDGIVSTAGSYAAGDNHDPDGDSDGSTITIVKP